MMWCDVMSDLGFDRLRVFAIVDVEGELWGCGCRGKCCCVEAR